MVAPGSTALVSSWTTPEMEPVATCAHAAWVPKTIQHKNHIYTLTGFLTMIPSPPGIKRKRSSRNTRPGVILRIRPEIQDIPVGLAMLLFHPGLRISAIVRHVVSWNVDSRNG